MELTGTTSGTAINSRRKHNAECISSDGGIQIYVSYWYEKSESDIVEAHGYHELGRTLSTELESVEVILGEGEKAIEILPLMYPSHKEYVINKLRYE